MMTDFENEFLKKEYVKSKVILKDWENEFITKNGRIPEKADIKLSPSYVRKSYNKYYKIKIGLLGTQILKKEGENSEDLLPETILKIKNSKKSKKVNNERHPEQKEFKDFKISPCNSVKSIDSRIWGAELNKTINNFKFKEEKEIIFNQAIAKTLLEEASFNKRNPRNFSLEKNKKIKKSLNISNSPLNLLENETAVFKEHDLQSKDNENIFKVSKKINAFESFEDTLLLKTEKKNITNENLTINQVGLVQQIISGSKLPLQKIQNAQESLRENFLNSKENLEKPLLYNFFNVNHNSAKEKHNENKIYDEDIIRDSDDELNENFKFKCLLSKKKRKFEESSNFDDKNFSSYNEIHNKKIKLNQEFLKDSEKNINRKVQSRKKHINDNYIKLNLVRKTYVKGKKKFNLSRYKKQKWKKEKKNIENCIESERKYSNINEIDYFETTRSERPQKEIFQFEEEKNSCNYNDLFIEKSQILMTKTKKKNLFQTDIITAKQPVTENFISENFPPFYNFDEVDSTNNTLTKISKALKLFGHSDFLPGQKETIMRILRGQSTLFISSTGGGKSLCYQLPAYLYSERSKCIALVISPLISLMEDQVSSSSFFKAGYLHSDQSQKQYEAVLEKAKTGKLYAILISPEMIASGDSSQAFRNIFKQLPPISFACIDEIHCMSHWCHNFRPSYLLLNRVLKEKLGIKTILGLTATATISSIDFIIDQIGISKTDGVIKTGFLPDNLHLSISRDENKDEALLNILKSPKFKDLESILIYCKRRDECERLAILIRTVLFNNNMLHAKSKKYKQLSWVVASYHAGITTSRRKMIQKSFMNGNIRIVVATVAFGMGINKSDIRAVIHYNIPKDFENYVQEIGRAGRNGTPAYCHLFLDTSGEDLCQLSSHLHSISIDRHIIRKLLEKVFKNCNCEKENKQCKGHEIAFSCDDTVVSLDIPQINIHTLLCYLELHKKKFIEVLSPAFLKCKIKSYKGINALKDAIKICLPLAHGFLSMNESDKNRDVWELDVIKIANEINWQSEIVKMKLKNLEWQLNDKSLRVKTGIKVEFFNLGFRIKSRGDLKPSELDEALDYLIQKVEDQKLKSLDHLDIIFSVFDNFASNSHKEMLDNYDPSKSNKLKQAIRYFFETEKLSQDIPLQKFKVENFDEQVVAADIKAFLSSYLDNSFNSRTIARIFHGLSSPNYPASIWCKSRFWRKHKNKDFEKIIVLANYEILHSKF